VGGRRHTGGDCWLPAARVLASGWEWLVLASSRIVLSVCRLILAAALPVTARVHSHRQRWRSSPAAPTVAGAAGEKWAFLKKPEILFITRLMTQTLPGIVFPCVTQGSFNTETCPV
jgi:hypothetical protein